MSGVIAATSQIHLSPVMFLLEQMFMMALLLWFTRQLIKFSWMESLWYSTGLTSILSFALLVFAEGEALFSWINIIFCFLPVLALAAGIGIRALFNCFAGMEDGGSVNSVERQRTLEMVEQGKITAEEGAELLEALGRSNAMLGQDKFSRLDMLILAGIAITVLGFFLPWIKINYAELQQFLSQQMGGVNNPLGLFVTTSRGMRIGYQSGYHTGAIGWATLIIAILAAIPVFITPKNFLYKISMLQIFLLLLDSALVITLFIRVGNRIGVGLPVCMVGLVLALVACFGKFKKLAA